MARINIPKKYLNLFVDQGLLAKALGSDRGTLKADLRAIREVIQARLSDRAFLERFTNDVLSTGELNVKIR